MALGITGEKKMFTINPQWISFTYSRDPNEMRNKVVEQKVAVVCSVFLHAKAVEHQAI